MTRPQYPVRADNHLIHQSTGHQLGDRTVADESNRDVVARELERGQPTALQEWPSFRRYDLDLFSLLDRGPHESQSGPVACSRWGSSITMRPNRVITFSA